MKIKVIKILSAVIVILCSIVIAITVLWKPKNISNSVFKDTVKVTEKGFEYNTSEKDNPVAVRAEKDVYDDMHRMANTKIIADEVWGEDEINEERLNKVIMEVMKSSFGDKDKLLAMLHNWKTGNFNNAVEEHNYLWEKLGGTVGKAKALKK